MTVLKTLALSTAPAALFAAAADEGATAAARQIGRGFVAGLGLPSVMAIIGTIALPLLGRRLLAPWRRP